VADEISTCPFCGTGWRHWIFRSSAPKRLHWHRLSIWILGSSLTVSIRGIQGRSLLQSCETPVFDKTAFVGSYLEPG